MLEVTSTFNGADSDDLPASIVPKDTIHLVQQAIGAFRECVVTLQRLVVMRYWLTRDTAAFTFTFRFRQNRQAFEE